MKQIFYLILFISSVNCLIHSNENQLFDNLNQNGSKLLIILVDGFRWDYVSLDNTLKGFPKIVANGVHAQYVTPIFPALSYPNWYTITTGLYAESHGMIQNNMYDTVRNDSFLMGPHPNVSHTHWWNKTEPLWINAEKQGVRTSMYLWDGCQVNFNGIQATYCVNYMGAFDFELSEKNTKFIFNKVLNDFSDNEYRLSFVYYELVDHFGHEFGPLSDNRTEATRQIDSLLNDLYDEIVKRKLDKELNVVIVSDHGMADVTNFTQIFLNETIDFNDVEKMVGLGVNAQIIPKPGKLDKLYDQLKGVEGMKVYKKEEIPESYHYKNSELVLPLLLVSDFGYTIKKYTNNDTVTGGNHGYDNHLPDMRAIMYGFGPAFKRNFASEPIEMVDHYNLFCHLLDINPHPNNGSDYKALKFLK